MCIRDSPRTALRPPASRCPAPVRAGFSCDALPLPGWASSGQSFAASKSLLRPARSSVKRAALRWHQLPVLRTPLPLVHPHEGAKLRLRAFRAGRHSRFRTDCGLHVAVTIFLRLLSLIHISDLRKLPSDLRCVLAYFLLMFLFRGMPFIDLAYLRKQDVKGNRIVSVSYTHLDVYKRQRSFRCW